MHRNHPGPWFCALVSITACTPYQQTAPAQEFVPEAEVKSVAPVPEPVSLDRSAGEPARVSGTIRDHAGSPAAGAQVCAWNVDPNATDSTPRCTATDSSGAYELAGLVPMRHEVYAGADEQQPIGHSEQLSLRPGESRTGVDLQLVPGGVPVHGVVRDTLGHTITGAWVTNFNSDSIDLRVGGGAAATRTDAEGRFTLWLSPGRQNLVAHADGYVSTRVTEAAAPGRYTLGLMPESVLVGEVVDAKTKAPVVGARVTAMLESQVNPPQRAGLAYTDAAGHYQITGLRPGLYKPRAEAPGRHGAGMRNVHLRPGASSSPQVVAVRPIASVSGRIVVAGDGRVCSQGQVTMHADGEPARVELAGPDGEVFFPAVKPGVHGFDVACPGAVAPPSFPGVEVAEAPVRDVVWEFAAGRSIRGVVVDPQGRPIAGVTLGVHAAPADNGVRRAPPSGSNTQRCQTDDNCAMDEICDSGVCVFSGVAMGPSGYSRATDAAGRFVIAGLPPGRYAFVSDFPGVADPPAAPIELAADAEGVRVVASRTLGTLGGVVTGPRGAPLAGAQVQVLADRGTHLSHLGSVKTDDDGRFMMFDVRAGDVRVRGYSSAFREGEFLEKPLADDIRVRIGVNGTPEVALKLRSESRQISGRVRGPDDAPVAGVTVTAIRESGEELPVRRDQLRMGAAEQTAVSDAAGLFTLTDLTDSAYMLRADPGGGVGEVFAQHVAAGGKATLTIPTTVEIAGQLAGASPEAFTCRLQGHDNDIARSDSFSHSRGRWAFEGLPPGAYELHCEDSIHHGALLVQVADRPQGELELAMAIPGSIRGRVLDAETRTPLPGVQVKIVAAAPNLRFPSWPSEIFTDDNGQFDVFGLPPGRTSITFPAYEPEVLETTVESGRTAEIWPTLRLAPNRR